MATFVSELKRRNVFRMAVLYVIASWLIMQVADVVIGLADLPSWAGQAVIAVLAIGLPIALLFSWFYEITPEGLMREAEVDRSRSITHITGRRIDFIVMALLAAAVIVFAYDKWWLRTHLGAERRAANSIAVLPFANMNDDPGMEFFSDGLAEELLNQLTHVRELQVISRTSSFSFKGRNVDIGTIAERLRARHILEGSVRVHGRRARISANLIDAVADRNLWSQTYDRDLDDILVIQDEIAREVVEALEVTLLKELPRTRKTDTRAYELYLRAQYIGNLMTPDDLRTSVELYREALNIDGNYVPAWTGLAWRLSNMANSGLLPGEGYEPARAAARRALEIDPESAAAYSRLGWIAQFHDGDLQAAAMNYQRALDLDPTDMTALGGAATLLQNLGRLDEAVIAKGLVSERDPVYPAGYANLGIAQLYAGQLDAADASFASALQLSPNYIGAQCLRSMTYLLRDDPVSALPLAELESFEPFRLICLGLVQHSLDNSKATDDAIQLLIERHEKGWAYNIAYVLANRGEPDAAFEWLEKAVEYRDGGLADIAVQPFFRNLYNDPRWSAFLARQGKSPEQLDAVRFEIDLPAE